LTEPYGQKHGHREGAEIGQRLPNAGLSIFEPDPIKARQQAEATPA
jgi:hypothetical protein